MSEKNAFNHERQVNIQASSLQQGIVFVLGLGEARLDALTLFALAGRQGLAGLQLTLGLGL